MKTLIDTVTESEIRKFFKGQIKIDEPLRDHTYMKMGGHAEFFFLPRDEQDLSSLLAFCKTQPIRVRIIGQGSNLFVSDRKLKCAVIRLSGEHFTEISKEGDAVYAGAGAALASLVAFSGKNGLSGAEFLAGIPGTVGGALIMNAGARDIRPETEGKVCSIADLVSGVDVMDEQGRVLSYSQNELSFGYRCSNFKGKIVIGARLEFVQRTPEEVTALIEKFWQKKKGSQEMERPSAGCVFKNPENAALSAAELIDRCRMKGVSVGDAQVSAVHANFIINKGRARFQDVRRLMAMVQDRVFERFKIRLKPEVEIWDEEG